MQEWLSMTAADLGRASVTAQIGLPVSCARPILRELNAHRTAAEPYLCTA